MKKFTTKPQSFIGEELKIAVTVEGVTYPVGSFIMTNAEDATEQFIVLPEQLSADFDEVKPRTRTKPVDVPTDAPQQAV